MIVSRLLVIEADLNIAKLIKLDLQNAGYEISHAESVMSGLTQLREKLPDLVLLDFQLSNEEGRDVLTRIRRHSAVPIIILSACTDYRLKVELLDLGANDYVVKPYESEELLVRIAVQLRRLSAGTVKFGPLELVIDHQAVRYKGKNITLSRIEFRMVQILLQEPGRVYSGSQIFALIWGEDLEVNPRLINVYVSKIRCKFRLAGCQNLIRNVRNIGYAINISRL